MRSRITMLTIATARLLGSGLAIAETYPVVDTGQTIYYDGLDDVISAPQNPSDDFYGQDAQHAGNQPSYSVIANGAVVRDNVTGLYWTQSIDWDAGPGIGVGDKFLRTELTTQLQNLNDTAYGDRTDWRVPTVKELYSLILFSGIQPQPIASSGTGGQFFLDGSVLDFSWGDTGAADRIIDMQVWSSTDYTSVTMLNDSSFLSANFADGRLKGYPLQIGGADRQYYAMFVAGNPDYGVNDFQDGSDGTISDRATSLMWTQNDSGLRMNWQEALAYAQTKNSESHLGYDDWRLPNAKELQSLVDYSRSPDATGSPAIDPLFQLSATDQTAAAFDESGDYGYHWTGTTFLELDSLGNTKSSAAVYISFLETLGSFSGSILDVHRAGAQRTDPKSEGVHSSGDFFGPQGDSISIDNYVLLVRPVPEPSSQALSVLGVLCLAWLTRLRRRQSARCNLQPAHAGGGGRSPCLDRLPERPEIAGGVSRGRLAVDASTPLRGAVPPPPDGDHHDERQGLEARQGGLGNRDDSHARFCARQLQVDAVARTEVDELASHACVHRHGRAGAQAKPVVIAVHHAISEEKIHRAFDIV